MSAATHRTAKVAAAIKGQSLNRYLLDAIDEANSEYKDLIAMSQKQVRKQKLMK